ncbi:MAG: hypothetical protein FJ295_10480 [Planctomycetes bacterium]|nr:hypothetical protein [Planctomycetota bacterium]
MQKGRRPYARPSAAPVVLTAILLFPFAARCAHGAPPTKDPRGDGRTESAAGEAPLPPWSEMRLLIESTLDAGARRDKNDLLSRSDLTPIFDTLRKKGWTVSDREAITGRTLADGHVLVQQLRSPQGTRLMRKISGEERIYDRLDRITTASGGEALIRDLIKLPDGERYALRKQGVAVPNLLDLLPKDSSAQTRTIRGFDKSTGKIYTRAQLLQQLEKSHESDSRAKETQAGETPASGTNTTGPAARKGAAPRTSN